tara:strand:+ start:642 stop:1454 length:813 start_codon:yes stop_codon:yes gene_type:complete
VVDDFSQDTSGTYSNSNSMGIDSGGYDPSQDNDLSSRLAGAARIAQDMQNQNIGGGGGFIDTYDAKQALQTARGITATNPYGYEGFFTKNFGIEPENIDYTYGGQTSLGDIKEMADINYRRYVNPMNDPKLPGFNPNKLASETQRDINRGFGSLFGSSLGESTQLGLMKEQRPDALSGMDTGALTAFSLAGAGLPSIFANMMSNRSNYVPADASQYEPARDPTNKDFDAETYDKGYMANTIDALYGEGVSKQASDAVKGLIDFATNSGKP